MSSGAVIVAARGVGRAFGTREVVTDLDLEVRAGEVLGLVGPNGGGKSTVLLLLAGLVRPSSGLVTVDGTPAHEVALARSGAVGLITADPGLYPLLTGRENLVFFARLYGLSAAEAIARSAALGASLGIEVDLDRAVADYSSGMRQKLSLLRALLMDPVALLLDEPTANLDPDAAQALLVEIRGQADAGRAIVWVTHDLVGAEAICDRVAILDRTLRDLVTLDGPRVAPAPGRLLARYRALVGAR